MYDYVNLSLVNSKKDGFFILFLPYIGENTSTSNIKA